MKEVFSDRLQFGNASLPLAGVTMEVTEPVKWDVSVDICERITYLLEYGER